MNTNNAAKFDFVPDGIAVKFTTPDGRHSAFEAPPHPVDSTDFDSATAHKADPKARDFVDLDLSTSKTTAVMGVNFRLRERLAAIEADKSLSYSGRRTAVEAAGAEALAEAGKVHVALAEVGRQLQATRAKLFAVPAVTADTAPADVELRQDFKRLTPKEQLRLLESAHQPEMAPLLLALVRSPLPFAPEIQAAVSEAHSRRVGADRPLEFRRYQVAAENNDWARRFVAHLAITTARAVFPSGNQHGFDPQKSWNALRAVKATDVLGIPRESAAGLDHYAAIEEARRAAS